MNAKYDKLCADIAKLEKKSEDIQAQLGEMYAKKTEMENLEIVNTVRAMMMDKGEIMEFLATLRGGEPVQKKNNTDKEGTENE